MLRFVVGFTKGIVEKLLFLENWIAKKLLIECQFTSNETAKQLLNVSARRKRRSCTDLEYIPTYTDDIEITITSLVDEITIQKIDPYFLFGSTSESISFLGKTLALNESLSVSYTLSYTRLFDDVKSRIFIETDKGYFLFIEEKT